MSRRRNQGRPRGWRDPRRAGTTHPRKPVDRDGAFFTDDELFAWHAYKAFLTAQSRKDIVTKGLSRTIEIHEEVLRELPNSAVTRYHLADLFWCAACLEEAMAEYEATLRLAPSMSAAHTQVAKCLLGLGEVERAKERLEVACRTPCVVPRMEVSLAEAHLLLGHYREGWRMHEIVARYQPGALAEVVARHVRGPLWDGRLLDGSLLIAGCDGFGEELQTVRYLPRVRQRVRSLTLLVQDALYPLLRDQFDDVRVLGYSAPPDPREFVAWSPMMQLPHVLGIGDAASIPLPPYLRAQETFRPLENAFKVGIRWAGDPGNAHDLQRSTHLTQWAPLLSVPGATFYSFQFQVAAAQLGEAVGAEIVNLVPELGDWNATAAALAQMDLVITVDSSLAHLAGALNRPVWIPLQAAVEWRWGLESPTTPWYPSARLFRQQRVHEWGPVFAQMAAALRGEVEGRNVEAA
jgi:glycosyl transferase family 9 (putative heptosyltransferase)